MLRWPTILGGSVLLAGLFLACHPKPRATGQRRLGATTRPRGARAAAPRVHAIDLGGMQPPRRPPPVPTAMRPAPPLPPLVPSCRTLLLRYRCYAARVPGMAQKALAKARREATALWRRGGADACRTTLAAWRREMGEHPRYRACLGPQLPMLPPEALMAARPSSTTTPTPAVMTPPRAP